MTSSKCAPVRGFLPTVAIALLAGLVLAGAAVSQTGDPVVRGVSWVGVSVSDLDASTQMYAEAAQLEEVDRSRLTAKALGTLTGHAGARAEARLLASTNAQLRFMHFVDPENGASLEAEGHVAVPAQGPGIAHVCFRADKENETYQKFLARGVRTLGNPDMVTLNPRFPVKYAYVLDADGIMLEVEHVDLDAIESNKPAPGHHHIRHVSLGTPDIDRGVAFYSKLLGVPSPRRAGDGEGVSGEQFDQVSGLPGTRLRFAWFQVGNLEFELIQYLSHPTSTSPPVRPLQAPGYNMVVFDVSDLDAARQRLVDAGGEIVSEPEALDGGTIQFGRDPDGNVLGFFVAPEDSIFSSQRFADR